VASGGRCREIGNPAEAHRIMAVTSSWRIEVGRTGGKSCQARERPSVMTPSPTPPLEDWETLCVHPAQVEEWKSLGFDPFEAALAQGDGFPPAVASHSRRQLLATAHRWRQVGLGSADGLRWHRAGFGVKEATRWRSLGVDVEAASARRAGYRKTG
jgi:hypothetical protein